MSASPEVNRLLRYICEMKLAGIITLSDLKETPWVEIRSVFVDNFVEIQFEVGEGDVGVLGELEAVLEGIRLDRRSLHGD